MGVTILGIESSCDDTSAAIIRDGYLLSTVIANQEVHKAYGGVVPELASRAHQKNIIPVVDRALKLAEVGSDEIDAVAFTMGPGLLGSLIVGTSFAKGFAIARNLPIIAVNHLQGHVLANFVKEKDKPKDYPSFPFLTLLVSGGNTQIILVRDYLDMEIIGSTIDDAAGEAIDKCAKVIGLPYPGGPHIDRNAKLGNKDAFEFAKPRISGLDFSFSGLKTSFLYFLRDKVKENPNFISENMNDLCASIQRIIVEVLVDKLIKASRQTGVKEIAIGGGVAANSGLRNTLTEVAAKRKWKLYLPEFKFTTDNAAMIAITGYYKYQKKEFATLDISPMARLVI
ncbi:MAG: tRNA (adenosine(37)-N6)-threonylcarbamoyltransferase complex transferase subunit TsaD [Bacteroidota bacterium]|nr:tRNA (adenosine(37)-N6)-threonylcarbamoyltransferase complex transferase subunit TsaD [Bacteroidota bacterium]MDP4275068.1 tRNA (adenosine(37)-N6)-threonylcarbamoyltransferase complex transferase subunit TsaD [Bacteroidota bacterium]